MAKGILLVAGWVDWTGGLDAARADYGALDGIVDSSDFFFSFDLFVAGCP